MNILRNEIRTGILVVLTLSGLVALLLYLGSPGVFVAQKSFRIYFDNAAGLEPGAPVLLAGRKIGQVRKLFSPVPLKERPTPKMETLVEVQVSKTAQIFVRVKAQITQPSLLGKPVIDFTSGEEDSGLAPDGTHFIGERQPGLADAVPAVLEKIDPALIKAGATLDSLQKTADNLTKLTSEGSALPAMMEEFKQFGVHLNQLSGPDGSLRRSLQNIETMTGENGKFDIALGHIADITAPGSDLTKAMSHAEQFTGNLSGNKDIELALRNIRRVSENMDREIKRLGEQFSTVGKNLGDASDTVKRQPWRLIWPSTKKYEDDRVVPRPVFKTTRK